MPKKEVLIKIAAAIVAIALVLKFRNQLIRTLAPVPVLGKFVA